MIMTSRPPALVFVMRNNEFPLVRPKFIANHFRRTLVIRARARAARDSYMYERDGLGSFDISFKGRIYAKWDN